MFGTLVSTSLDRETLEYIENPDHVAAVSRNVQDKIRIACMICRSRKRSGSAVPRTVCDEAESGGQAKDSEESVLDNLDNCTDESLFTPWIIDTPMQHDLDGSSSSSSGDNTASKATVDIMTPEMPTPDMTLTPLPRPSATDRAGDVESLERGQAVHVNADGDGCCLLSSISFLNRLVSRSASCENRIDLLLADVRSSIETLATFMLCERCASRVEQDMLIAMTARQISVICGMMANCYRAMYLRTVDSNTLSSEPEVDVAAGAVDVFVSTYRVNLRERLHLLKSLVSLQLVEFQQHIDTIKTRYRSRPDQGQAETLIEAEDHIKLAQLAISGLNINHL
ncbi:hypothetical protein MferCBS31731_003428 [Microsporum ferrugineum]